MTVPIATPEEVAQLLFAKLPGSYHVGEENRRIILLHLTAAIRAERSALSTLKEDNERLTAERDEADERLSDQIRVANEALAVGASLTETVGKLREALEPFDNVDDGEDDFLPDDTPVVLQIGRISTYYALKLGDFRRARAVANTAALTPTEPEAKETTNG